MKLHIVLLHVFAVNVAVVIALEKLVIVIAAVVMKIRAAFVNLANHVMFVADAVVALLKKRR